MIAEAGTYGRITVSTQMAGRGTDIRLGGSDMRDRDRVVKTGGLYVIGYGRYPSSRLDDQLRGRAGRQGDPGGSVFYVSVEDDLITTNLPEAKGYRVSSADGEITDPAWKEMVNHAQRIAEGQLLELHRNTWRYNQIIDVQRSVVLEQRRAVLHEDLGSRQLAVDCPETYQRLVEEVGEEEVARAARLVTLYHLDRGWADHNAFLADLWGHPPASWSRRGRWTSSTAPGPRVQGLPGRGRAVPRDVRSWRWWTLARRGAGQGQSAFHHVVPRCETSRSARI